MLMSEQEKIISATEARAASRKVQEEKLLAEREAQRLSAEKYEAEQKARETAFQNHCRRLSHEIIPAMIEEATKKGTTEIELKLVDDDLALFRRYGEYLRPQLEKLGYKVKGRENYVPAWDARDPDWPENHHPAYTEYYLCVSWRN